MTFFGGQNLDSFKQLAIVLVVLIGLGIGQPFLWGYVERSAELLHTRQTEQQQLAELTERFATITTQHEGAQAFVDQLRVAFPKQSETSQVVDRLEQLADKQKVIMTTQNIATETLPAPISESTKLVPLLVTLKVDGPATNLLQYLAAAEHIQELTVVRSWKMQAVPPLPGELPGAVTQYEMSMNVLFYLQPD